MATLDGCQRSMLVRSAAALADLRTEVTRQAGVPAEQQRLLVAQQRALSPAQRAALAALRLCVAVALWAAGWLAVVARWLLGLPPADSSLCSLALETASGRQVQLAVGPDTTLAQLQAMVLEQHGEALGLQHLRLQSSSSNAGGGGGS